MKKQYYYVAVVKYVMPLRTYSSLRKWSVEKKWSLLTDSPRKIEVPYLKAFNSKKDALKFYQESSKIYDKDFCPEKGYVAMIGIFMTHITDEGRKFPRQRISRPLNSNEMKALEDLQND